MSARRSDGSSRKGGATDSHLEYLRAELRGCEMRRAALMAEQEGGALRWDMVARDGNPKAVAWMADIQAQTSEIAARAIQKNEEVAATWRRLIDEHLARTSRPTTGRPTRVPFLRVVEGGAQ